MPDSNPKPGQVFKLLAPSRNTPVSAVRWDPSELLSQESLRAKFALDADPIGRADFPLLMYHGTSYNSAKNLLHKRFPDFGTTKSFYIGTDLARAVEWTEQFLPHERAIVMYALPPNTSDIFLEQVEPLRGTPMQLAVEANHLALFLDDRVVGVLIDPPLRPKIDIPIPEPATATHRSTLTDFRPPKT